MNNRGDAAIVECIRKDLLAINGDLSFVDVDFLDLAQRPAWANLLNIRNASMIVLGGGGIFSSHFLPVRRQNLYLLGLLARLSASVVTLGPGFCGPLGTEVTEMVITSSAQIAKASTLSGVRDEYSMTLLRQQGVDNCSCIGDPALFYSVRRHREPVPRMEKRIIGFNLAAHDWIGQENNLERIFSVATRAAKFFRDQGYTIRYFLQSDLEREISRRFSREVECQVIDEGFPAVLETYRDLDFLVGMMLHSTIFSASVDVPVISLAYDIKNRAFMKLLELDDFVVDADSVSLEELTELMKRCSAQKEDVSRRIKDAKSAVHREYERFLDRVAQLL